MANPLGGYWVPQFKWQLVGWLSGQFPTVQPYVWERMGKRKLYAIYHKLRRQVSK